MASNKLSATATLILFSLLAYSTCYSDACCGCTKPTPPAPAQAKCPENTLKLGVCADILGLVNVVIGNPPSGTPCCTLLKGLADLEAALCLCTAIKGNVLGLNLNVPVALSVILSACQKTLPSGFQFVLPVNLKERAKKNLSKISGSSGIEVSASQLGGSPSSELGTQGEVLAVDCTAHAANKKGNISHEIKTKAGRKKGVASIKRGRRSKGGEIGKSKGMSANNQINSVGDNEDELIEATKAWRANQAAGLRFNGLDEVPIQAFLRLARDRKEKWKQSMAGECSRE